MDRRALIAAGLTTLGTAACAQTRGPAEPMGGVGAPNMAPQPGYSTGNAGAQTYTRDEIVNTVSDFLGVTAESAGAAIESVFRDNGSPTGYIAGRRGLRLFRRRPRRELPARGRHYARARARRPWPASGGQYRLSGLQPGT